MGSRTRQILLAIATVALLAAIVWLVGRRGERAAALDAGAFQRTDAPSIAPPSLSAEVHDPDRSAVEPRGDAGASERDASAPQGQATLVVRVVRDENSEPVPSPVVEVLAGDAFARRQRADVAGVVRFWVPVGEPLSVRAESDAIHLGCGRARVEPLAESEVRTVKVGLPPATMVSFHGHVLDRSTGAPLAGARITRERSLVSRPGVETDPAGRFATEAPTRPMGEPELLRVEHDGHHPMTVEVTHDHARPDDALAIFLGTCGVLEARVVGSDAFELVRLETSAFVLAAFGSTRPLGEREVRWDAPLDARRVATFECLEPSVPLTARLVRADGTTQGVGAPLVLARGERREVTWELSASIRGRVVDERGAPVVGADLWLIAEEDPAAEGRLRFFFSNEVQDAAAIATTDAAGGFSFSSVVPGAWWVGPGVFDDGSGTSRSDFSPNAVLVQVSGPGEHTCELRVWRDLFIEGRVTAPDGAPVDGSNVSACATQGRGAIDATADADGRFALGPLAPGSYEVRAWGTGELAESVVVTVEAGATDVELALRRNGAIVVHAPDLGPGDGALTLQWATSDSEAFDTVLTTASFGSEGRFRMDDIAPGRYDFALDLPDGRVGTAAGVLVDPEHEYARVDLVVERGGLLRIRCEGGGSSAYYRIFRDGAFVASGALTAPGAVDVVQVPPGRNRIVLRDMFDRIDEAVVDVEPGETAEVVLHLLE